MVGAVMSTIWNSDNCLVTALRWKHVWLFLLAGCVFGVKVGSFYIGQIIKDPPTVTLPARMLYKTIHSGEPLEFLVNRTEADGFGRGCAGYIVREFRQPVEFDGGTIFKKRRWPMLSGAIMKDEERKYIIVVETPANMSPGHWFFYGRTHYDCGFLFGGAINYDTELLPFEVLPGNSSVAP